MARHEHHSQFILMPPEDEPIFRFGSTLLAERAAVWLDGPELVFMHQMVQRSLSLFHLRIVSAHVAMLFERPVRHLALIPYSLDGATAVSPAITFQDRFGAAMEHEDGDFDPFIQHFLTRLKRFRPFLTLEGNEAVLLRRDG